MGEGVDGIISGDVVMAVVSSVIVQNRKNNWIWNRSLVFPCTSYIYLVFCPSL